MKIELSFAELHAPLFLAGKNFGMKLDHKKHAGIKLLYNDDSKFLEVGWTNSAGDHDAWVPLSNVASMTPDKRQPQVSAKPSAIEQAAKAGQMAAKAIISAQVSTPQSHVHAGPGHGDTGQEKKKVVL